MGKGIEDPTYVRWRKKHPRFPGVDKCVEILRRKNTRGGLVDVICHELQTNAANNVGELIEAFRAKQNESIAPILLGIIVEAKLPQTLSLFMELLATPDENLRHWAVEGLRSLGTPEARKAL